MKRRQFNFYLMSSIAGLSLSTNASIGLSSEITTQDIEPLVLHYASAGQDQQGQHWLSVMSTTGVELLRHALPSRAHQVLKHPFKPWVFVVARRPGHYLLVVDMETGKLVEHISSTNGQHFSGHMQISSDGRYLYTTENITQTSVGQMVVRDMENSFSIIDQFDTGGLGPHQLMLLNKENIMVIANGGIHTRGREKLNLENMSSNLTYLNLSNGDIIEQVVLKPEFAQLSIRHIDINDRNDVVIAMQYQGEKTAIVPLVALHQIKSDVIFLDIPMNDYYPLKHYCGSACFDKSGNSIAVSAPRGDSVLFWDTSSREYLGKTRIRDGSGLAVSEKEHHFIVSSGRGKLYELNPSRSIKQTLIDTPNIQWDNHLAPIG